MLAQVALIETDRTSLLAAITPGVLCNWTSSPLSYAHMQLRLLGRCCMWAYGRFCF